jgi:hypothetical protein
MVLACRQWGVTVLRIWVEHRWVPPLAMTVALCLGACTVPFQREEVSVAVPALPVQYDSQPVTWHIEYWDGTARNAITHRASDRGDAASLSIAGASLVVVAALPVVEVASGVIVPLAPYGALITADDRRATLRRDHGEIAQVLLSLARRGLDPSLVNIERLAARAAIVCSERGTRCLDTGRLASALAAGEMSVHDVALTESTWCEIRDIAANAGTWLTDEPLHPLVEMVVAGDYCYGVIEVALGSVRRIWRVRDGAVELCTIAVDTQGRVEELRTYHVVDELVGNRDHFHDLRSVDQ